MHITSRSYFRLGSADGDRSQPNSWRTIIAPQTYFEAT